LERICASSWTIAKNNNETSEKILIADLSLPSVGVDLQSGPTIHDELTHVMAVIRELLQVSSTCSSTLCYLSCTDHARPNP